MPNQSRQTSEQTTLSTFAKLTPLAGFTLASALAVLSMTPLPLSYRAWYIVLTIVGTIPCVVLGIVQRGAALLQIYPRFRYVVLIVAALDTVIAASKFRFLSGTPKIVSGAPVLTVKGTLLRSMSWDEYWHWSNGLVAIMAGVAALMYAACLWGRRKDA